MDFRKKYTKHIKENVYNFAVGGDIDQENPVNPDNAKEIQDLLRKKGVSANVSPSETKYNEVVVKSSFTKSYIKSLLDRAGILESLFEGFVPLVPSNMRYMNRKKAQDAIDKVTDRAGNIRFVKHFENDTVGLVRFIYGENELKKFDFQFPGIYYRNKRVTFHDLILKAREKVDGAKKILGLGKYKKEEKEVPIAPTEGIKEEKNMQKYSDIKEQIKRNSEIECFVDFDSIIDGREMDKAVRTKNYEPRKKYIGTKRVTFKASNVVEIKRRFNQEIDKLWKNVSSRNSYWLAWQGGVESINGVQGREWHYLNSKWHEDKHLEYFEGGYWNTRNGKAPNQRYEKVVLDYELLESVDEAFPKPKEDKDKKIKDLENKVQKLEVEKESELNPEPNPDTGEIPLQVGVAYKYIRDKAKGIVDKEEKKKEKKEVKVGKKTLTNKRKEKIDVEPEMEV